MLNDVLPAPNSTTKVTTPLITTPLPTNNATPRPGLTSTKTPSVTTLQSPTTSGTPMPSNLIEPSKKFTLPSLATPQPSHDDEDQEASPSPSSTSSHTSELPSLLPKLPATTSPESGDKAAAGNDNPGTDTASPGSISKPPPTQPSPSTPSPSSGLAVQSASPDGMSTSTILAIMCGVLACFGMGGAMFLAILRTRPRFYDSDEDHPPFPTTFHSAKPFAAPSGTSYARPSEFWSEPAVMSSMRSDVELAISSMRSDLETAMSSIRSNNGATASLRPTRQLSGVSGRGTGVGIAIRVPSLLDVNPNVYAQHPQLRQTINQCRQNVLDLYNGQESITLETTGTNKHNVTSLSATCE
ncbi:hypothetical protein DYB38_009418 [Aphanomyces astaci]|uniref:Uncharacterized protein n=1 Tax=Aphanomyces astaci TaxID=112090 RepID=A0A397C0W2_APHAT|nr:hypothetical protein DYB38_009418 [Aphanomyces astaci]